jgi:predicted Rossmann fold nucleotide-binding protein DprA/Smf involved in DNA uptake
MPLTSADDVLEALGIVPRESARPEVGEVASWRLERLPANVDELLRASALTAGEVAAALAELEIAQLVAEGEGVYRAKPARR